ncbi:hypothetical protein LA5095_00006 [Roseibium album]|nr:hypothetical protein LA5095_00006 [Roseibium album]
MRLIHNSTAFYPQKQMKYLNIHNILHASLMCNAVIFNLERVQSLFTLIFRNLSAVPKITN